MVLVFLQKFRRKVFAEGSLEGKSIQHLDFAESSCQKFLSRQHFQNFLSFLGSNLQPNAMSPLPQGLLSYQNRTSFQVWQKIMVFSFKNVALMATTIEVAQGQDPALRLGDTAANIARYINYLRTRITETATVDPIKMDDWIATSESAHIRDEM